MTVDASAPTKLSKQKAKLAIYSKVIKLDQRNKALFERIRRARKTIKDAQETNLF